MSSQNKEKTIEVALPAPPPKHNAKRAENCKCKGDCPCCDRKAVKPNEIVKALPLTVIAIVFGLPAFAQDATPTVQSFWADPINHPMMPVYLVFAFLVITMILTLVTVTYLVRIIKFILIQNEKEKAEKAGIKYVVPPTVFEKVWQDINGFAPLANEQDIDMGHSYDGIRELDNHLPPWWKGLFVGCIIWGIVYLIVYHVTDSFPLSLDEYQAELTTADEKAKALRASRPAEMIDENTLTFTADADLISKGKVVFVSNNCGSCHRSDGGGNTIGPNLTDQYWLHGGSIKNIYSTINAGKVEKGMPAWGKVMSASDVRNVAFYIMSLQGSHPKDAKAPQGELYKPEEVKAPADSIIAIVN